MEKLEDYSSNAVFQAREEVDISKISTRQVTWALLYLPSFFLFHSSCNLRSNVKIFFSARTGHGLWSTLSWGSLREKLFPGVPVPQWRDLWLSDRSMLLQPRLHRGTVRKTCFSQCREPARGLLWQAKVKKLLQSRIKIPVVWLRESYEMFYVT